MALMPWKDELLIGISKIDEQHRWLVDKINALHDELTGPTPDRKVVGEILEALVDYTMNHFIIEEEMFERYSYPQTAAHKEEHDAFTAKIIQLLDKFLAGTSEVGADTMNLLKDWLTHHIMTVDKAYAPFLKSKGEK